MLSRVELGLEAVDAKLWQRVEVAIVRHGSCGQPWLDSGIRPLLSRPGKRLRPALVFAGAACGPVPDPFAMVNCAASMELMHLSSLVHDDLMDDAASRSGVATLHMTLGRDAALLAGDHLLAAGGGLVAHVSKAAVRAWHQCYLNLCAGQIRETANRYQRDTRIEEYLAAVSGKTGALMRASCLLGALSGGLGETQVNALAGYGEAFGMVFQLVDDLMDVVSTQELWTKPVRCDIPNGVYTAAVLAALADPRSPLHDLLGREMSAEDVRLAYDQARSDGVAVALGLVEQYVARAERLAEMLPDTPSRRRLAALPRMYASRAIESRVAPEYVCLVRAVPAPSAG